MKNKALVAIDLQNDITKNSESKRIDRDIPENL